MPQGVSENKAWPPPPLQMLLPTDCNSLCLPMATEKSGKNDMPTFNAHPGIPKVMITPRSLKLRVWGYMLGGSGRGSLV